jgi:hypothetical protein
VRYPAHDDGLDFSNCFILMWDVASCFEEATQIASVSKRIGEVNMQKCKVDSLEEYRIMQITLMLLE